LIDRARNIAVPEAIIQYIVSLFANLAYDWISGVSALLDPMKNEQAARFARKVVEDHGTEGTFNLELPAEDLETVANALRNLGCEAKILENRAWIVVYCPEKARISQSGPHLG
jgi:hypothetical protein